MIPRRLLRLLLSSVVAASTAWFAACTSFSRGTDSTDGRDASEASSGRADVDVGGPATIDGAAESGDAVAPPFTFCADAGPYAFCDDFDESDDFVVRALP